MGKSSTIRFLNREIGKLAAWMKQRFGVVCYVEQVNSEYGMHNVRVSVRRGDRTLYEHDLSDDFTLMDGIVEYLNVQTAEATIHIAQPR